jgi:hypothetical protein
LGLRFTGSIWPARPAPCRGERSAREPPMPKPPLRMVPKRYTFLERRTAMNDRTHKMT